MDNVIVSINDPKVLEIPIEESGEEMVDLLSLARVYKHSAVNNKEKIKLDDCEFTVARRGVAQKLKVVLQSLPEGWGLYLIEPYRSYKFQKELYSQQVEKVGPEKATEFVSNPDVYSPHVTGAAIDVAIVDADRNMLDVGNWFDYDQSAHTDYANLTPEQKTNRQLLIQVMTGAGFANYPNEWWHWSYGDKYWGFITGNTAIYDTISYL